MSSTPPLPPEEIARDATWLAQALDPAAGVARLVEMSRDSYRAASFLDDRLFQQPVDAQLVPWPEVEAAMDSDLRSDSRWIFHIGHVGSTLISRLLGELDGVLAIREPRLLRDLALCPAEVRAQYIGTVPKLMSRTFAADELACVKATSFASELAADLVPAGERALFVYATPRNYTAGILAGENSLEELRRLGDQRTTRLTQRDIAFPPPRHDADRAAAAWACEITALEAAADAMPDRHVDWVDFDRLLADLPARLANIAAFFGFPASAAQLATIASGPQMRRYSKDPSFEYTPQLRRDLLDQEFRLAGHQINAALATLADAAERSPILARALRRAES